jgi:hypothetical protein
MNRTVLEQPFDRSVIKTRRVGSSRTIVYVEGAEYIRRLNDAFDGQWSFEVVDHQIRENEVIVLGKLTAGGATKTAFGGSPITVARESGEVICLADDLKAAATDCLKKASSLLGVGLHLYSENGTAPAEPSSDASSHAAPAGGNGGDSGSNGGNGATPKQLGAIYSIGRKLGLDSDDIQRRSTQTFGCVAEALSKKEASTLIGQMKDELDTSSPTPGEPAPVASTTEADGTVQSA